MYKYKTDRFDIERKRQILQNTPSNPSRAKSPEATKIDITPNKSLVRKSCEIIDECIDSDDDLQDELNDIMKNNQYELNIDYNDNEEYDKIEEINIITGDDCKHCNMKNSIRTVVSEGMRVCTNCRTVAKQLLDETAEWRQYQGDSSEGMVRCSVYQAPLYTPGKYNKLQMLQNWISTTPKERSINKLISDMIEKCTTAGIKKCAIDDIKCIYKECTHGTVEESSSTVRGLNRSELMAAITMYACKKRGIPRLPEEIAEIYHLNVSDISNGWRTFTELMRLKDKHYDMVNSKPEEYLIRLAPRLNISREIIELAVQITRNIKLIGIAAEHTPPSIAAASILLTAQIKGINDVSVTDVSQLFRISCTTSDKIMKKIEEYKKVVTDNEKSLEIASLIAKRRKQLEALM